jgi:hypothetical protein
MLADQRFNNLSHLACGCRMWYVILKLALTTPTDFASLGPEPPRLDSTCEALAICTQQTNIPTSTTAKASEPASFTTASLGESLKLALGGCTEIYDHTGYHDWNSSPRPQSKGDTSETRHYLRATSSHIRPSQDRVRIIDEISQ